MRVKFTEFNAHTKWSILNGKSSDVWCIHNCFAHSVRWFDCVVGTGLTISTITTVPCFILLPTTSIWSLSLLARPRSLHCVAGVSVHIFILISNIIIIDLLPFFVLCFTIVGQSDVCSLCCVLVGSTLRVFVQNIKTNSYHIYIYTMSIHMHWPKPVKHILW